MDTIDAVTRLLSALGACTALWVFATHLVDTLARSRTVGEQDSDTPTESDVPAVAPPVR